MSSILCGRVAFSRPFTEREIDDIAFALVEAASRERLGLQLGHAITQTLALEIFSDRVVDPKGIVFVITNSPARDVSDAIINQFGPEYPEAEPDGPLPVRLERVQRFLCKAIRLANIDIIIVSMSVGFDTDYVEETIYPEQFVQKSLPHYKDEPESPAIRFLIRAAAKHIAPTVNVQDD